MQGQLSCKPKILFEGLAVRLLVWSESSFHNKMYTIPTHCVKFGGRVYRTNKNAPLDILLASVILWRQHDVLMLMAVCFYNKYERHFPIGLFIINCIGITTDFQDTKNQGWNKCLLPSAQSTEVSEQLYYNDFHVRTSVSSFPILNPKRRQY